MRFRLPVTILVAMFLVGCAGGDEEFTAPTEETEIVEETTIAQAPPRDDEQAAAGGEKQKAANVGGKATTTLPVECQLAKAEADLGPQGAEELINAWEPQWIGTPGTPDAYISPSLPDFLAERGYTC